MNFAKLLRAPFLRTPPVADSGFRNFTRDTINVYIFFEASEIIIHQTTCFLFQNLCFFLSFFNDVKRLSTK